MPTRNAAISFAAKCRHSVRTEVELGTHRADVDPSQVKIS